MHVRFLCVCIAVLSGCTHGSKQEAKSKLPWESPVQNFKEVKASSPILLRLKAEPKRIEKVAYSHRMRSTSYEDLEIRHQKEELLDFLSQAETVSVDPSGDSFTQRITVLKKEGNANLHDFAMPEVNEKLEIVADSRGRIIRSGEYPTNSIFYVPPISLPEEPVKIGDTWTMQAAWLSLDEMVPYQLDMVSILKNVWECGKDRCAEIEVSGEVSLQGTLAQTIVFKSMWRGFILFNIDAGTLVWSRVDSEEQLMSGNVRRSVTSCLEASMVEPTELKLMTGEKPCAVLSEPGDITPPPAPVTTNGGRTGHT